MVASELRDEMTRRAPDAAQTSSFRDQLATLTRGT